MTFLFKGRNRITSGYRLPDRPDHNGIDVVGVDSADILAPADGVVTASLIITCLLYTSPSPRDRV